MNSNLGILPCLVMLVFEAHSVVAHNSLMMDCAACQALHVQMHCKLNCQTDQENKGKS